MVEKRPLIPQSKMDGGLATKPHPVMLSSNQSPDQQNTISVHESLQRRPGLEPLNMFPAMGSGLKSEADTWTGAAVNSDDNEVDRRAWRGSGLIPYLPAYHWDKDVAQSKISELRCRFVYKAGNKDTQGFNAYYAGAWTSYYRRFLVGSGKCKAYESSTVQAESDIWITRDVYIPDWVVYLIDGSDPMETGSAPAGASYLAFAINVNGVIYSINLDTAVEEGEEIDIMAQVYYNSGDGRVDYSLNAAWASGKTDSVSGFVGGQDTLVNSRRTIQVFGPYFPEYYWAHTPVNANADPQSTNYDWEKMRMIPGEGVIEDLVLSRTGEEADQAVGIWPTKTRITQTQLEAMQEEILGYWPGWGHLDRQFVDRTAQANPGYIVPGEPLLLEDEGRLPGLLTDRVSEWVVKDFEHDTDGDQDQYQEGAMLRQFVEASGKTTVVNAFEDNNGDPVYASVTIGATATFHEAPNHANGAEYTPVVCINTKRSDEYANPLAASGDADLDSYNRLCEIRAFEGASATFTAVIFNTGGSGNHLTLTGPPTPLGRPVTATLSFSIVRTATHYNTTAALFVNGVQVDSDTDTWANATDQYWGPMAEIIAGRFHGEMHDIRLGTHDYNGDETVTTVAVPDVPLALVRNCVDTTAVGGPGSPANDDLININAEILHDGARPGFVPSVGNLQAMAIKLLGATSETESSGRDWVTGWKQRTQGSAWTWNYEAYGPMEAPGKGNAIYSGSYIEVSFHWIYGWWRAWPNRMGDIHARKPRTPGRCWQTDFHTSVSGHMSHFGGKADTGLVDVMNSFGDATWVGVFSPYSRHGTLGTPPCTPVFACPYANYLGSYGRKMSPHDLGLKWGEGCRYPTDEDGAVGFVHQWKDDVAEEVFLGSGRNLYLLARPWSTDGTRLRVDGSAYWESASVNNGLALYPSAGVYKTVTVAFTYQRKSARAGGRVIAAASGSDGTDAWVIYESDGVLFINEGSSGTYASHPVYLSGTAIDNVFSDRQAHWVVVELIASVGVTVANVWVDGEKLNVYGVFGFGTLQSADYKLRVGGGVPNLRLATVHPVISKDADIDCVIRDLVVISRTSGAGGPDATTLPLVTLAGLSDTNVLFKVPFTDGAGMTATNLLTASGDMVWFGRDLKLIDDNLPFLGLVDEVPETIQVEQDAVLVVGTGRPRRWRRDLYDQTEEAWNVDYLGLPDPWEQPLLEDFCPLSEYYDAGTLTNTSTYAAGVTFYDEVRGIRSEMVYASNTFSPTDGLLRLINLPGLPYGDATHLEVWLSSDGSGIYRLARRMRGVDHEIIELAAIRYNSVIYDGAAGEPPIARHVGLLQERLYLGNLPYITAQGLMVSAAGLPWSFPASNVIQFGDSQDGVITALQTGMGRMLVAQEGLCSWFTPGADLAQSSIQAIARSIGFNSRWGPVTWSGPLFGMTNRGPALLDGVKFQFVGRDVRDQFVDSDRWWSVYDGDIRAWWFISQPEDGWCQAMMLTEGTERETWSKCRFPAISCVSEIIRNNRRSLVVGTRLGRVALIDGEADLWSDEWVGDTTALSFSAFSTGKATLSSSWAGQPQLLRGQPLSSATGESLVYGPDLNLWAGSTAITDIVVMDNTDFVTAAGADIGALEAWWTCPWLHFGFPTERKETHQMWLCFAALVESMTVYFDSAISAAVVRKLEAEFPASPAGSAVVDLTNGFMRNPIQLHKIKGANGVYFRFKIATRSNKAPWQTFYYILEGERAGGRAAH